MYIFNHRASKFHSCVWRITLWMSLSGNQRLPSAKSTSTFLVSLVDCASQMYPVLFPSFLLDSNSRVNHAKKLGL